MRATRRSASQPKAGTIRGLAIAVPYSVRGELIRESCDAALSAEPGALRAVDLATEVNALGRTSALELVASLGVWLASQDEPEIRALEKRISNAEPA